MKQNNKGLLLAGHIHTSMRHGGDAAVEKAYATVQGEPCVEIQIDQQDPPASSSGIYDTNAGSADVWDWALAGGLL